MICQMMCQNMSKYVKLCQPLAKRIRSTNFQLSYYSEITWKLHLFLSGKGRAQESSVPGSLSDSIPLSALPNRQVHSSPGHKTTQKPRIAGSFLGIASLSLAAFESL